MRKLLALILFLALLPFAAFAKPAELQKTIKAEEPYGKGTLTWFLFEAYDAELWTDAETWSYEAPFALSITYKTSFSGEAIAERSVDEMNGQQKLSQEQKDDYFAQLKGLFPAVKDGDRITAYYAKGITQFYHNGKLTGSIVSPEFSKRFLDIWLSEKTSQPSLRRKLLNL